MQTITITRRSVENTLESLRRSGASAPEAEAMWAKVAAYFAAESAAHSVNVDRAVWSPIIAATGDAIAAAISR